MVVFTTEKVVIIVGVTLIVIVLAYVLRLGGFSRRKKAGADSGKSSQGPSDST